MWWLVAAERGGREEAVLVRREGEKVLGRVRRDCYGVLRALPPRCGRGHRQPNQTVAALDGAVPEPRHRRFR